MAPPISIPARIRDLPAYTPIEPFDVLSERIGKTPELIIKLDANENPYGMSPNIRKTLANLRFGHIYPDPENRRLRKALVPFCGAPFENILPSAGADELIDLIMRVTLEVGDVILNCPPTFGMYSFDGDLNGARVIELPRDEAFKINLPAIVEAIEQYKPKLIFLTSPNNPDGSLLQQEEIEKILEFPILVVLDEAYIEFADPENLGKKASLISQVPQRENLVILRTFSKLAGLAGLRVGYGIFPLWLMEILWKAKQPYNVNVAASEAAITALEDVAYLHKTVSLLVKERERLMSELRTIPSLSPYPSESNFILCRVTGADARQIKENLADHHGIFIRYFNKPGLTDCIRISVGTPEQNNILLAALRQIL